MDRPEWARAALAMAEWKVICLAPKDGTFLRLRCGTNRLGGNGWGETVGHWQSHEDMKAGGAWFDRDGCYLSPWPQMWAPEHSAYAH